MTSSGLCPVLTLRLLQRLDVHEALLQNLQDPVVAELQELALEVDVAGHADHYAFLLLLDSEAPLAQPWAALSHHLVAWLARPLVRSELRLPQ